MRIFYHRKKVLLYLFLILLLGFLFRIYAIGEESYWFDEMHSITIAGAGGIPAIWDTLQKDVHPPLYFVVFHYWMELTGKTEISTPSFFRVGRCIHHFLFISSWPEFTSSKFNCYNGMLFISH